MRFPLLYVARTVRQHEIAATYCLDPLETLSSEAVSRQLVHVTI